MKYKVGPLPGTWESGGWEAGVRESSCVTEGTLGHEARAVTGLKDLATSISQLCLGPILCKTQEPEDTFLTYILNIP